jgi:hypothetical protein
MTIKPPLLVVVGIAALLFGQTVVGIIAIGAGIVYGAIELWLDKRSKR